MDVIEENIPLRALHALTHPHTNVDAHKYVHRHTAAYTHKNSSENQSLIGICNVKRLLNFPTH